MQVKAHARYIRMSPQKVRLVIDLIRGASVRKAQTQLQFTNKAAAQPVLKLLNSAVANAEHNFQLNADDLKVATIVANEGPTLKRWHPRAQGRAMTIRKRTTHISIVLEGESKEPVVEKTAPEKKKKAEVQQEEKNEQTSKTE